MISHSILSSIMNGAVHTTKALPIKIGAVILERNLYSFFGKEVKPNDAHLNLNSDFLPLLLYFSYAAILEELMFRGILMPMLEEALVGVGVRPASAKTTAEAFTALLFSYLHQPGNRIAAFISGMDLGKLAHSFGLSSAISGHVTHNAISAVTISTWRAVKKHYEEKASHSNSSSEEIESSLSASKTVPIEKSSSQGRFFKTKNEASDSINADNNTTFEPIEYGISL